ncbi:MAG: RluA family pseudouridine synthase [Candidatus Tectomicrobia bacterium]|uniref:Pseudouridine synthase n=1 Tax=Tectimicrobiota bacterium TaxID=2528274 RepID=A0A932FVQ1_UNCTE|nr:RluA family pseudouridine synthase [Candidatus Tectomicrobia bacterium]
MLFHVTPQGGGRQRLDAWLAREQAALSRSQIQRLIEEGRVRVNGSPVKAHYRPKPGDQIEILLPEPQPALPQPEPIPLEIVYEDSSLVVINKPAGLVVHPGAGNPTGTLVNALLYHCPDLSGIGGVERPGIVHRLDKETSGLLVVAKDDLTHRGLARQWEDRSIRRRYLALVKGRVAPEKGRIETLIGRHPVERKKMAVVRQKGRVAITEYQILERWADFSLLELHLRTGRTHQIRVHLASRGHPVVGDRVYGRRTEGQGQPLPVQAALEGLHGLALHAATLGFVHPRSGEPLEFEAALPPDFAHLLQVLRRSNLGHPGSPETRHQHP